MEASTRRATATAQRMSREARATQETLARARMELLKRLRESETAQAEYHRASSYVSLTAGGRRRPAAEDKAGGRPNPTPHPNPNPNPNPNPDPSPNPNPNQGGEGGG